MLKKMKKGDNNRKAKEIILIRILIFLQTSFFLIPHLFAQNGTIQGRIYNENNNEPIAFANIVIYGTNIGTTSDLDGNFIFKGIEPGFIKLAASSVGFEKKITEEFMVTNAKTVYLDIPMQEIAVKLEEVVVKASPFKREEESPVSMRTLGISDIEKNPGSNRDISKVIQSFPGVAATPAYRNDVIVRGGGSSENSFFLDGVEIPNLNHFATQGSSGGPVGIINVDFIREVDFYSSAFPANRGGAISSVIEMKQIDGNKDRINTKLAVGASDLALTLEGPINEKSTFVFSARRSYLQLLFSVLELPFLPTYNDFQLKNKIKFNEKNELTIVGLGAIDQFKLNTGLENPDESQQYILDYVPVNEQWNYTIGAVYRHYRDKSYDTWVLSRNFLNNSQYKYKDNDESSEANKILDYQSDEGENKFRYEHTTRKNNYKLTYGVGLEQAKYNNTTFQKVYLPTGPDTINYSTSLELFGWNLFSQMSYGFFDDRLTLSLGLRTDANNYSASMENPLDQLSPRFSASYALNERFFLNGSVGRYYQLPAYTTLGYKNSEGEWVNKNNKLKYIQANHMVGGIEYLPDRDSRITLEGFLKLYSQYPFSVSDSISLANKGADFGTFGDEEVQSISKGRAYGAEFLYRKKISNDLNLIVSYTLVRSEFEDTDGNYVPSAWDNIHLLNATATKSFEKNWDVGAKWRFVGGAPYTPYDYEKSSLKAAWDARGRAYLDYSRFNSERLDPFHQLDIRIDKQYFYDNFSLMFYLDIQNVYNFKVENQGNLLRVVNDDGNPLTDPENADRYVLKNIRTESGTILPTVGIILEF